MKVNRLYIEFKCSKDTGIPKKRTFWDWLFRRPDTYLNYHTQRCTSLKIAVTYLKNLGANKVINAQWCNHKGIRFQLIKDGKLSNIMINTR